MHSEGVAASTADWYRDYYRNKGNFRNDLRNPEVLFQTLAYDQSFYNLLRKMKLELSRAKLLDVGSGSGGSVPIFVRVGFDCANIHGIDVLQERIDGAQKKFPTAHWTCGDARKLPYAEGTFDVVHESTMLVQITDEPMAAAIASEMLRVTKPGGYLVLADWRYSKPFDNNYRGLTRRRISELFKVGSESQIESTELGALIPPLGRFLSKHLPVAYFPATRIMPALVGQTMTLLKKLPR